MTAAASKFPKMSDELYQKRTYRSGAVRYVQWGHLWSKDAVPNGWHLVDVRDGASRTFVHNVNVDKVAFHAALLEQREMLSFCLYRWFQRKRENGDIDKICADDIVNKLVAIAEIQAAGKVWP